MKKESRSVAETSVTLDMLTTQRCYLAVKNGLRTLLQRVKQASEKAGLKLNIKKTKIMTTAALGKFMVDGEEIEIVKDCTFLGATIESEGGCRAEVKRRITLGRVATEGLKKIWKDKNVSLHTKTRLVRALIFPAILYGSESWTLTNELSKKIDACEMWIWRRLLGISWKEKKTNKEVLDRVGDPMSLGSSRRKQKMTYFGHVARKRNSLERDIMVGEGEGARKRGRPRRRWLEEIKEWTGSTIPELMRAAQDRVKWRKGIVGVARDQRSDSTR